MKKLLIYILMISIFVACEQNKKQEDNDKQNESKTKKAKNKFAKLHEKANIFFGELPDFAENKAYAITDEQVALGKQLYFDNRLSKDNTQSCNTCHNLDTYGVDNKSFSEGNDGGLGGRNSPTTLNAALHLSQFWDGREPDVEAQAGGPILNPVEMAMPSEKAVIDKLSAIEEYVTLFGKAFPEEKNAITYDNLKKAIGAFERKLITPSKFDKYLAGDKEALSDAEKEGMQVFMNSGCTTCHSGNLLGGKMYQKFGLFGDYWELTKSEKIDNGRFDVTQNEADKYMFKVPSLRNIEKTFPYFHDGSVQDLKEAVAIMGKSQVNKDLSEEELNSIVTFLNTLTGEVPAELKQ